MNCFAFDTPISILVGFGYPKDIANVRQAFEFLNEWNTARRGPLFIKASSACSKAMNGEVSADEARSAFMLFADASGILRHDNDLPDAVVIDTAERTGRQLRA